MLKHTSFIDEHRLYAVGHMHVHMGSGSHKLYLNVLHWSFVDVSSIKTKGEINSQINMLSQPLSARPLFYFCNLLHQFPCRNHS